MHLLAFLLDLFFPRRSLTGEEGIWVTAEELQGFQLFPFVLTDCALRRRGMTSLDHIVAAGKYDSSPLFQKTIRNLKYGRIDALADILASIMLKSLPGLLPDFRAQGEEAPVVCAVPLHWTRRFARGFNQSELLARGIARKQRWHCAPLLKRMRPTGHQAHRPRKERLVAVRNAFCYIGPKPVPKRVLLVDDVLTTGATLQACAEALKQAGVLRVEAVVAAYD